MFGLLNVNKPSKMTSRAAVDRVARIAGKIKIGHAGTLDPLADGVLLICLGQATRLVPFLHELPKRYRATYLLGRASPTDDIEGDVVVSAAGPQPDIEEVRQLLPRFIGKIQQTPPAFSAVKVRGRRAYDLARRGVPVSLAAKTVTIHRIELLRYSYPELVLDVTCGTGTYLRSLGRDIGRELGTGAVMSALCRVSIGSFTVDAACRLDELTSASLVGFVQGAVAAVAHLPQVVLTGAQVAAVCHGRTIEGAPASAAGVTLTSPTAAAPATERAIAAVDSDGRLVAILQRVATGQLKPVRVFRQAAST